MSIVFALALAGTVALTLVIYPGELSWFSQRGTRWLYNRAAKNYHTKYHRHDYAVFDQFIAKHVRQIPKACSEVEVLDLGCGTGRATLAVAQSAAFAACFTAVDFSSEMLGEFRKNSEAEALLRCGSLSLCEAEIDNWLRTRIIHDQDQYDLVLIMEVGEFLPQLPQTLELLGALCAPGAILLMTRPAGLWAWCFPGRAQGVTALGQALARAGFEDTRFKRWRSRYQLVSSRRRATGS